MARISDFWTDGQWNQAKIQQLHDQEGLPQTVIEDIISMPILDGHQDYPRWILSQRGNFTLHSAWDTIRTHRPIIPALKDLWNMGISSSISIFIWRLLSNRIPVDTKLQWRNIELASKCHCCLNRPRIETLQHLFVQGEGALKVWNEFDAWFPGNSHPLRLNDTIPDRLESWSKRCGQPTKAHLSGVIPCLVFWFLWAERNKSRH